VVQRIRAAEITSLTKGPLDVERAADRLAHESIAESCEIEITPEMERSGAREIDRDLALCCRGIGGAPLPAPANPADQRRQPNPKITGDLALRATAGLRQADRFLLKFLPKPSLLGHRVPHSSSGTLNSCEESPAKNWCG